MSGQIRGPVVALAAALLATLPAAAHATIITTVTPSTVAPADGMTAGLPGLTVIDFNLLSAGESPAGFSPAPAPNVGHGGVVTAGNPGLYAAPNGDTSPFYTVADWPALAPTLPAAEDFTPGGLCNYLGLYWGSIDKYNIVTFFLGGTEIAQFTGASFPPADGDQHLPSTNEFVGFEFTTGGYDMVRFSTTDLNFEFDNLTYGRVPVPEPDSWMLLGAGALALAAVRLATRRRPAPAGGAASKLRGALA